MLEYIFNDMKIALSVGLLQKMIESNKELRKGIKQL